MEENKIRPLSEQTAISIATSIKYDCGLFLEGDRVCKGNKTGVITRISDKAIHVMYDDGYFEKFHFNPYHHMQTNIKELKRCE